MHHSLMPTFEELLRPLPIHSPRRWYYELSLLFLRSIGMASEGLKIAHIHGFDSGKIMNYIYNNKPAGRFYFGKFLDRAFLNQVTCKAFRSIKEIQKNMIMGFLEQRNGDPTFIVDLASGKADYIFDVMREMNSEVKVLLRDINNKALMENIYTAKRLNLQNKVKCELGNALDVDSLEKISSNPDLVIEVGLYGIIHDDDLIKQHLCHVKKILNPEAILFNVQTYNPQIEFIARVLKNQAGERCVWHLRSKEHLINWAEEAGFKNPEVTMDPYGIYAVVMMRNSK